MDGCMISRFCFLACLAVSVIVACPSAGAAGTTGVIADTGFEQGGAPGASDLKVSVEGARTGKSCLVGEVTGPDRAARVSYRFPGKAGHKLEISFWVRSDKGSRCVVWVVVGKERARLTALWKSPNTWTQVRTSFEQENDAGGTIEIVAPSSYGDAPPGKAWIDDLKIVAVPIPGWKPGVRSARRAPRSRPSSPWVMQ